MKKLLLTLAILSATLSYAGTERDQFGRAIATTSNGVKRDANGKIIEVRTVTPNGVITRDANGKTISVKAGK
jgi:hypothetical protein